VSRKVWRNVSRRSVVRPGTARSHFLSRLTDSSFTIQLFVHWQDYRPRGRVVPYNRQCQIQDEEGMPPDQHLIFVGKQLEDGGRTLATFKSSPHSPSAWWHANLCQDVDEWDHHPWGWVLATSRLNPRQWQRNFLSRIFHEESGLIVCRILLISNAGKRSKAVARSRIRTNRLSIFLHLRGGGRRRQNDHLGCRVIIDNLKARIQEEEGIWPTIFAGNQLDTLGSQHRRIDNVFRTRRVSHPASSILSLQVNNSRIHMLSDYTTFRGSPCSVFGGEWGFRKF